MIDRIYGQNLSDCLDIDQIKNICKLYKTKYKKKKINIDDIVFSSPHFKKVKSEDIKKCDTSILETYEFSKKYAFFIRVIYACLKIGIELFNVTGNNIITLKNNYQLLKSLEKRKKTMIRDHISILNTHITNINDPIESDYESFFNDYVSKIKIIDRVYFLIKRLINEKVFDQTDNMLSLLLPYFYNYTEFIEVYN